MAQWQNGENGEKIMTKMAMTAKNVRHFCHHGENGKKIDGKNGKNGDKFDGENGENEKMVIMAKIDGVNVEILFRHFRHSKSR